MTQGDKQPPIVSTIEYSPPPGGVNTAVESKSDIHPPDREAVMDHQRFIMHHQQGGGGGQQQTTAAADTGDVKTLLHFVNLASSDIKAALDKSAQNARRSSIIDSSPMFVQNKPLKQQGPSSSPATDAALYREGLTSKPHHPYPQNPGGRFAGDLSTASSPPNHASTLHFTERLMASASLTHRDDHLNGLIISDSSSVKGIANAQKGRNPSHIVPGGKRASTRYRMDKHVDRTVPGFRNVFTLHNDMDPDTTDWENPVPLRKRRLPASFWQEPGKSENHKTVEVPNGLSSELVSPNLKFPLFSNPGYTAEIARPKSLDKNAIYPNTDQNYSSDLSFVPSLTINSNNSDSLYRTLNFPYSICSCQNHQHHHHHHTEQLYGYNNYGSTCSGLYTGRQCGGEPTGLFGSFPDHTTGTLSRWHFPLLEQGETCQSANHHPAPRVIKPIPTKTRASYPSRYHPIYT